MSNKAKTPKQDEQANPSQQGMTVEQGFQAIRVALEKGQAKGAYTLEEAASLFNIYNGLAKAALGGNGEEEES